MCEMHYTRLQDCHDARHASDRFNALITARPADRRPYHCGWGLTEQERAEYCNGTPCESCNGRIDGRVTPELSGRRCCGRADACKTHVSPVALE